MRTRVHRLALLAFRRLPTAARRRIVRWLSPAYTVGAICLIERSDGRVLLVRQVYRQSWGIPGGLLERGEDPAAAARREVLEETGLVVDLVGEPAVVVDPVPQRVDVVFNARPVGDDAKAIPSSPEIALVEWFPSDELPDLQLEATQALVALARIGVSY